MAHTAPAFALQGCRQIRTSRIVRSEYAEDDAGKRLIPFNTKIGSGERIVFDRDVLGLEPGEVGRFWIQSRIRDEGLPHRAPCRLRSCLYASRARIQAQSPPNL